MSKYASAIWDLSQEGESFSRRPQRGYTSECARIITWSTIHRQWIRQPRRNPLETGAKRSPGLGGGRMSNDELGQSRASDTTSCSGTLTCLHLFIFVFFFLFQLFLPLPAWLSEAVLLCYSEVNAPPPSGCFPRNGGCIRAPSRLASACCQRVSAYTSSRGSYRGYSVLFLQYSVVVSNIVGSCYPFWTSSAFPHSTEKNHTEGLLS